MSEHHENLKIIAFVGNDASRVVEYLTEKNYPKLSMTDMASQIEHLENAGQHRIITSELIDFDTYHALKHEFHSELHLVGVVAQKKGNSHDSLLSVADYYVQNEPGRIDELLEKLDFKL